MERKLGVLTNPQSSVYNYMMEFYEKNDQLPPCTAIAKHFEYTNNAAWDNVRALEKKGWIEKNEAGKYRFVRVLPLHLAPKVNV